MIRKEKPLVSIAEEIMKGKPGRGDRPDYVPKPGTIPPQRPIKPGKPKPMPIKPKPTEGLKQIAKSDNYTLMAKRMNNPNGFYYN